MFNSTSYFPDKVDDMIFFQDNDLDNMKIMNNYNNLISQSKYNEANDYINQQENIYGFFSDFFNLIENRIYNLQEYLLSKSPKKQPFIYYNKEELFPISDLHVFSDVDEREDILSILLFSNNDTKESIDNLFLFTGEEGVPQNVNKNTIWV